MQWLVWLQKQRPDDIDLLSQAGYVQLIIGHIPAAETTFQVSDKTHNPKPQSLNLVYLVAFMMYFRVHGPASMLESHSI